MHVVAIAASFAMFAAPASAAAQTLDSPDSVDVVPGARYRAGALHRLILGDGYRELWTTPIRVPVLRPDTFAGGLEVLERGGGLQTVSIRLGASAGREFVFRSVDKDQGGGLHEDLQGTLIDWIAQDQVSSKHPAAAVVVAPIARAAGVMHASPTLAVMADVEALGEFREEFAGMLGIIEERPTEAEAGPFSGFERIIGTERLLERLEESPDDRVEREEYLRARLVDLLVGDWDRHPDQWRWAQRDSAGRRYWLPIPRDRDNSLNDFSGLVGLAGGAVRPNVVRFGPRYHNLYGMVHNAQGLDRRILGEVPRERWLAIAGDVRSRVTDSVIDEAVGRMPAALLPLNAAELAATLKARRDGLTGVAEAFYAMVALEPEIYGADTADRASVERLADGSVRVRIADEAGVAYVDRTFLPGETEEIRLQLRGGDDQATVQGDGPGIIQVRVLGGGSDDVLVDTTRGSGTLLYDDRGDNRISPAPSTVVDQREYEVETP